ncbi:MAG TPA: NlpC/P60 family protein, partial [Candidatus Limnocylindria bacterium]|nr:NlpC/P60 family protein [Candidatus Limnocylindria bacterium]
KHPLHGLNVRFSTFLRVDWSMRVTQPPAASVPASPDVRAVVQAAKAYIGKPFAMGADGPGSFDSGGLVFRAFADAGQLPRIAERRKDSYGYLRRFTRLGRLDARQGQRGDLVVYGNGQHIGIYLGNGKVISALVNGVQKHPLHGLNVRFSTFLRVDWGTANAQTASGDRVTTAALTLRQKPAHDSAAIGRIGAGRTFTTVESVKPVAGQGRWLLIRKQNGKLGWIHRSQTSAR